MISTKYDRKRSNRGRGLTEIDAKARLLFTRLARITLAPPGTTCFGTRRRTKRDWFVSVNGREGEGNPRKRPTHSWEHVEDELGDHEGEHGVSQVL